jgi:hypothetical protein
VRGTCRAGGRLRRSQNGLVRNLHSRMQAVPTWLPCESGSLVKLEFCTGAKLKAQCQNETESCDNQKPYVEDHPDWKCALLIVGVASGDDDNFIPLTMNAFWEEPITHAEVIHHECVCNWFGRSRGGSA